MHYSQAQSYEQRFHSILSAAEDLWQDVEPELPARGSDWPWDDDPFSGSFWSSGVTQDTMRTATSNTYDQSASPYDVTSNFAPSNRQWTVTSDSATSTYSKAFLATAASSDSSLLAVTSAQPTLAPSSLSTSSSSLSAPSGSTSSDRSSLLSSPAPSRSTSDGHAPHSIPVLSTPAIIGIAAGAGLALLLLLIALVWICCTRRRKRGSDGSKDGVQIDQTWRSDHASMSDAGIAGASWSEVVTPYTLAALGRGGQGMGGEGASPCDGVYGGLEQQIGVAFGREAQASGVMQPNVPPPVRSLVDEQAQQLAPARVSSSLMGRPTHTRGGSGNNISSSTFDSSASGQTGSTAVASSRCDAQVKGVSPITTTGTANVPPATLFKKCSAATAPTAATQPPSSPRHDPRSRLRYLSSISTTSASSSSSFTNTDAHTLPAYQPAVASTSQPRQLSGPVKALGALRDERSAFLDADPFAGRSSRVRPAEDDDMASVYSRASMEEVDQSALRETFSDPFRSRGEWA